MNKKNWVLAGLATVTLTLQAGCHSDESSFSKTIQSKSENLKQNGSETSEPFINQSYRTEKVATFNEPWAMVDLPDGRFMITERKGALKILNPDRKEIVNVSGLPQVSYGGQGGLGDIALHPNYTNNHWIYLSYAERGKNNLDGAVVVRAELDLTDPAKPTLKNIKRVWEQVPKVEGQGHYSHRILFDDEAKLWISSGERQQFTPSQDMKSNLGKILRLNDDGTPALGNPFYDQGGVTAQIWSLGHRNPLGIAFDHKKQLWDVEMGPKGGDELNLVVKGENYGYPFVSNGDHYDGKVISNHDTRPEFKAPAITWTPVISPSSLIFYQGNAFPQWKNKALISGLSSQSIVVVDVNQQPVKEVQRLNMGKRIRDIHQTKDGTIWVLEDEANAKLLKFSP
ncbi:PQQ-dependent sugar dehydrogenase [Acinetobacter shaoyimingii]|uniref:PQQ-dependent sugar dehydrogenase n=1 Tax=Acinetobacter shaoyimingii TaxID=2715164 RepID=A0A6G8RZN8_9GAMM|nr:PQQ-dependent sugar dehydrogenase [Acinetobacter shaoyimingii]QIO07310.1 PQQ-dependent sugar dehydrogenase [Acinetobacter shaoyimingii]